MKALALIFVCLVSVRIARFLLEIFRLRSLPYREYLESDHWRLTRLRCKEKAGWRCEECGKKALLEVHHKTYARVGFELERDLEALCHICHSKRHGL